MNGLLHALATGVLNGRWTIEDLDQPTPGWQENDRAIRRNRLTPRRHLEAHQNLVRDFADDHPNWQELIRPPASPAIDDPPSPALTGRGYGTPASRRQAALLVARYDARYGRNPELLSCPSSQPINVPSCLDGPIGCWRA